MMLRVLLNVTAVKSSGALTILKDCIAYLESLPSCNTEYHLCTSVDYFSSAKNLFIHKIKIQNWFQRIYWDNGGLQRWCRKIGLEPDVIFSLQNTSTKYRDKNGLMIVQAVCYHQPIPLMKYKWNGLSRLEYKMWLYSHFYPYFVNRNNATTKYIVQLSYIKRLFLKRFKNITEDRVFVVKPNIPTILYGSVKEIAFEKKYVFVYPATPLRYKNHKVIINALVLISKLDRLILNDIEVIFTIDSLPDALEKEVVKGNIKDCIHCVGVKPYSELFSYYKSATALLFPSVIESFGMPLVEAASLGIPIIASDLAYAHEVLEGYDNVSFADPYDAEQWAALIRKVDAYKQSLPMKQNVENSWKKVFDVIESNINR